MKRFVDEVCEPARFFDDRVGRVGGVFTAAAPSPDRARRLIGGTDAMVKVIEIPEKAQAVASCRSRLLPMGADQRTENRPRVGV